MTSLTFSPLYNSTRSSPWIDYGADIVYLGADSGQVFKITSVFNGTPTLPGGIWPVTINAPSYRLTAPVLDSGLHVLMVGSASGNLYQIDTTSGAVLTLAVGATARLRRRHRQHRQFRRSCRSQDHHDEGAFDSPYRRRLVHRHGASPLRAGIQPRLLHRSQPHDLIRHSLRNRNRCRYQPMAVRIRVHRRHHERDS